MPDPAFLADPAVARYLESIKRMPAAERRRRLQLVADFAAFVGHTPSRMIAEIFDEDTRTYRRREFYTGRASAFAAAADASRNDRLWRGHVVRAFFVANGRRLLPEVPEWMLASS